MAHPIQWPKAALLSPGAATLRSVLRPLSTLFSATEPRWALKGAGVQWNQVDFVAPKPIAIDASCTDANDFPLTDGFVAGAFGIGADGDAFDGAELVQTPFSLYSAFTGSTLCWTDEEIVGLSDEAFGRFYDLAIAAELITATASGGMGLENSARVVTGAGSTEALKFAGLIQAYHEVAGSVEGFIHMTLATAISAGLDGHYASTVLDRYTPVADPGYTSVTLDRSDMSTDPIYMSGPIYYAEFDLNPGPQVDLSRNRVDVLKQRYGIFVFDPMSVVTVASTFTQPALTIGAAPQDS